MGEFRKTKSKEDAIKEIEEYKKEHVLPCELMPSSSFFRRVCISMPFSQIDEAYAAAKVCKECPLREQCEVAGKNECIGMWGGVSRWFWKGQRRCYEDDWPFDS